MKLPEYKTAQENITLGVATPLEKFIYENEPFDRFEAAVFRKELQEVLDYVANGGWQPDAVVAGDLMAGDTTIPLPLDQEPE